jgi:hypothetical protein
MIIGKALAFPHNSIYRTDAFDYYVSQISKTAFELIEKAIHGQTVKKTFQRMDYRSKHDSRFLSSKSTGTFSFRSI